MKRDKIISIRARSDLVEKANEIIEQNTKVVEGWTWKKQYNELPGKYGSGASIRFFHKFSIADLFEIALKEFIDECSTPKK